METIPNNKAPIVFVSYSWTSPEHEQWVYTLAERLRASDNVDVKLDKWELKEGQDKYAFMEKMVLSPDIEKIIIICDRGYCDKANSNLGGVGTEKLLITPEVYENVEQTKVIPIVAERDENGKEYLPNFIKTRIYIDLSDDTTFEENYEKLVRSLYNAPLYRKPPLGGRPVFLDEQNINTYKTSKTLKQLAVAIDSNPKRVKGLLRRFSEEYIEELRQLKLSYEDLGDNTSEADEKIMEKINSSLPLRNDFIEILKLLSENEISDTDWLVELFEKVCRFTDVVYGEDSGYSYEIQYDQFKFILHEMFLYSCALLLKHSEYNALFDILSAKYFLENGSQTREENYVAFRMYIRSLDDRNRRLGLRKISLHAQVLLERVHSNAVTKEELIDIDLLLHYLSSILFKDHYKWFPITYIYRERMRSPIRFLAKLKSRRRANDSCILFGVQSIRELKEIIAAYTQDRDYRYNESFYRVPTLHEHIKEEEVGIDP